MSADKKCPQAYSPILLGLAVGQVLTVAVKTHSPSAWVAALFLAAGAALSIWERDRLAQWWIAELDRLSAIVRGPR